VDKALFTITCTTCKARLAVRSADAVGAILECPKCESMVQVVPPDGWMPAEGPAAQPPPAGPPPLNRVADCPLTLELEPAGGAAWRIILLWTAGLVATSAVVVGQVATVAGRAGRRSGLGREVSRRGVGGDGFATRRVGGRGTCSARANPGGKTRNTPATRGD